ncbi:MAG: hypothetical protein COW12_09480 [Candidatus Omnitrophica bacterium CG12_big_fil_rev_8_21_14_0_65_45_16]|nr:MAG: hypothetical protein COW12_09480 [Candidatus Omnitrophica bacterium CG12_big_fil_rev_8_21_14_0_65_45_16]
MHWFAILLVLALIQRVFYGLSMRTLMRTIGGLWVMIYIALIVTEIIRRFFLDIGLDWWTAVVVAFLSCAVGEGLMTLFQMEGKSIEKQKQSFPSLSTFSVLFLTMTWLQVSEWDSWEIQHIKILLISFVSIFFSMAVIALSERIRLSDVPRLWRGLPILLMTAAIYLMTLYGLRFIHLP